MTKERERGTGLVTLVAGLAATVVLIVLYQDWWAIVFSIWGATSAILERRGVRDGAAIAIGIAVAASVGLAGLGAFFIVMSPFSCARPDVPCPSPPPILMVGLGALVTSVVGLVMVLLWLRREPPHIE